MLLARQEMTFDFGSARLDPVKDQALLGWIFNQFLYGEVTGIQCGHWLYNAPDLEAARFLARQAVEEMQHVDNFVKILALLGGTPQKPHPALRFLATGMMGGDWAEHVALEMAQGEGFVLMALYALIDILDHEEVVTILKRAVRQEERHVDFGEQRTIRAVKEDPRERKRLLGFALVSMFAVQQLARFMHRLAPQDHPVMRQLPDYLRATLRTSELRLERLGLLDRPLAKMSAFEKTRLVAGAYATKLRLPQRASRLTDTYLADPQLAFHEPQDIAERPKLVALD
jgi:bacterioferritin (cytochrome b1)